MCYSGCAWAIRSEIGQADSNGNIPLHWKRGIQNSFHTDEWNYLLYWVSTQNERTMHRKPKGRDYFYKIIILLCHQKQTSTNGWMCDFCNHEHQKLERELLLNWKRNGGMSSIFTVNICIEITNSLNVLFKISVLQQQS